MAKGEPVSRAAAFRLGTTIGGAGGAGLVFAAEQNDWQWPEPLVAVILVASIIAIGVALVLWLQAAAAYFATSHRSKWIQMWSFKWERRDWLPFRRLIALEEASALALKKTHGKTAKAAATRLGRKTGRPLGFMATALTADEDDPIRVYGYSDEWSPIEEIPIAAFRAGHISDDCKSLEMPFEDKRAYVGLSILKRDFRRRLAEIKKWNL